jgi:hypothetical protein
MIMMIMAMNSDGVYYANRWKHANIPRIFLTFEQEASDYDTNIEHVTVSRLHNAVVLVLWLLLES